MSNRIVIGLGFGDEGKGVVTEYLCSQNPTNTEVVRFSGGHQCAHKVMKGDKKHTFASFGSGTLSGCPTYWSKYCTFEPVGFWNEYTVLREKGIFPRIRIHSECPVTTPYDIFANRQAARENEHGTTGTGFFRTKQRHLQDGVKLTVGDFLYDTWDKLLRRLDQIRDYYGFEEILSLSQFLEARVDFIQLHRAGFVCINCYPGDHQNLVFEGSQGLLLDPLIGYMPHCTPSDVTPRNALKIVNKIDEVYLVTRAYQTRHGNGPMTNIGHPLSLVNTEHEGNVCNDYQGKFRTSILDLDQLKRAKTLGIDRVIQPHTRINLVITCIDQLSSYEVSYSGRTLMFHDPKEIC